MLNLALEDKTLLLHLLQTLQPVVNEAATPVMKKARLDGLDSLRGVAIIANDLIQATSRAIIHCR